jgi:hypothetical protein
MDSRDESDQVQDEPVGAELEDSSISPKEGEMESSSHESEGNNDPLYVQKRLKQQQRAHLREMKQVRAELQEMRESHSRAVNPANGHTPTNPYMHGGEPPDGVDEQIHRAVTHALNVKEGEQRKLQEAASKQHMARKYQDLDKHLTDMGEKYEDFDDIVRGDVPFTETMRDYALTLPKKGSGSAGEVLYKLGKNREELHRISKLHPLDQAEEMARLSHALIAGGEVPNKPESHHSNPLGNVKHNPVRNSASITEKTSPGDIRRRMRAGKFK